MNKHGNPFEVTYMTIGSDYLPKEVSRHVNKNIAYGGGGGSQTQTTSIDPDIKRAVLPALQGVTKDFRSGDFGQIAGQKGVQEALGTQKELAQSTLEQGLGTENLLREMRNTEGNLLSGSQGALGSARADRGREAALADKGMVLQQADLAARQEAANAIGGVAEAQRGLEQQVLDKDVNAAERYFGMLQGVPQGSTSVSTGGGK